MKNYFWKSLGGLMVLAVIALFTTQCQTEVAGIDNNALGDEITDSRSATAVTNLTLDLCGCITTNYPVETLSAEEINGLLLMREEEKMARDVYLGLNAIWNSRVFANIAKSEQQHMDVMLCLLQKYELTDPVGANEAGVFVNSELQELYNNLMEQGSQSLIAAFQVGATIEDVDIFDLMNLSEVVDNEDILAAFNELTKGSRNHLRAFIRQLTALDVVYAPQYITPELFDEILSSPRERGGELCFTGGTPGSGGIDCPNNHTGMGSHGNGGTGTGVCPNGNDGTGTGTGVCPYGNDGTGSGGSGNNGDCPYDNDGTGTGTGTGNGNGSGNGGNSGGNGNGGNGGGNGNGGGH